MFAILDGADVPFTAEGLMRAAQLRTGLSDWGDLRFLDGLRALVRSFREEGFAAMSAERARAMGPSLIALLDARLRILDDRKKYPQIAQEAIVEPIFFIGMARTGSTFIQTLFAQDPANIAAEFWEMMLPSPPPRFGMGAKRQERVAQIMKWHMDAAPGFDTQHPYFIEESYRALAECGSIMEMSFASWQFCAFYPVASYEQWFLHADMTEAVEFHHLTLQHLQWGRPHRHWVSKAVEHGVYLERLLEEYPDAHFVWTHRDPYQQMGSFASNIVTVRQYTGLPQEANGPELARQTLRAVRDTYALGMAARDKAAEDRFHDVYYHDLTRDPVGTIRSLYDKFGRPLTAEAELRMEVWLRNNKPDKHGKHVYDAANFGLTRKYVEQELAEYLARFGAPFRSRP
jgi:hypothetical protein